MKVKRGSALLIVLGMVSFLTISAIAFSAWMRASRVPSSYLLRSSSSRWLLKAALAEALNDIEVNIGNQPHPGVPSVVTSNDDNGQKQENANVSWRDRIFYRDATTATEELNFARTVPVLTLEGLAHLPAPIINDVRYRARLTDTASWAPFAYDSGRYAYVAVDISDYFDVNRTMASPENDEGFGGRTSADTARVSLAYLFEDKTHMNWRTDPEEWDKFMDNYVGDGKVPLLSWVDLNLTLGQHKEVSGMESIWYRVIEKEGPDGKGFSKLSDSDRAIVSNMVFTTESWYPPAGTSEPTLDISIAENQPFVTLDLFNPKGYEKRGMEEVAKAKTKFFSFDNGIMQECLQFPEVMQLCDYLDVDSVPLSLAIPTTERTPMIVGLELGARSKFYLQLEQKTEGVKQAGASGSSAAMFEMTYYTLRIIGDLQPTVTTIFPFKHNRKADDGSFNVQVMASVTLVPAGNVENLRRPNATYPAIYSISDWKPDAASPSKKAYTGGKCASVLVMNSTANNSIDKITNPVEDKDYLQQNSPSFGGTAGGGGFNFDLTGKLAPSKMLGDAQLADPHGNESFTMRVVKRVNAETGVVLEREVTNGFMPSNDDLSGDFATSLDQIKDNDEFIPVVHLAARIVDANGETVDMMPACPNDDKKPSQLLSKLLGNGSFFCKRSALRFYDRKEESKISFAIGFFESLAKRQQQRIDLDPLPRAYVADDPRFNFAPEDLVAADDIEKTPTAVRDYWLKNTSAFEKEGDFFMATSDAGYLQSKYEFAHLLNITGFSSDSQFGSLGSAGYDGLPRTTFGNAPSFKSMWRTYRSYKSANDSQATVDRFDKIPLVSGTRGTRVCPYTPDTTVMMGALAQTPCDWWTASTNNVTDTKKKMLKKIDEAVKYTFSEWNESDVNSKVKYVALERLARELSAYFRKATEVDGWEEIYDGLDWDGELLDGLETDVVRLDSVDRKFLHGFWRECFAVRQQLFLVFVRAEPMMIGGGIGGKVPPTLGGRAVALIWRDPRQHSNGAANTPHRMRVLFYRPLD